MITKIFGAALIIFGCGGVGFSMIRNYKREEKALEELLRAIEWMILELNYRMPPLAVLCRDASKIHNGVVSQVLDKFSRELDQQVTPDVSACMHAALSTSSNLPEFARIQLKQLGTSLGGFDLQGQLSELEGAAKRCRNELEIMRNGREGRLQNYQTLGLCAGAALVIFLL